LALLVWRPTGGDRPGDDATCLVDPRAGLHSAGIAAAANKLLTNQKYFEIISAVLKPGCSLETPPSTLPHPRSAVGFEKQYERAAKRAAPFVRFGRFFEARQRGALGSYRRNEKGSQVIENKHPVKTAKRKRS
jgi:hypothetical protein